MSAIYRGYSGLTIKAVDKDKRTFRGLATTPAVDRMGDIVEPLGVRFVNPLPLLWQHDATKPIGTVTFSKPTAKGVEFTAELPDVEEEGILRDRINEAWQSIRHGLVRAVSIGFRAVEYAFLDTGGVRFDAIEVFELSAVTIPAQAEAVIYAGKSLDRAAIETIKRFDTGAPAATGPSGRAVRISTLPGASGPSPTPPTTKGADPMATKSLADQISGFEATRAAKSARMSEIMSKAAEAGVTLDAEQETEYDDLAEQVRKVDKHLERLAAQEQSEARHAKPVEGVKSVESGSAARGSLPATVKATPKVAPGIRFARLAKCVAMAKGSYGDAIRIAEMRYGDDEALQTVLKAAVVAGSTVSGNWAADLVSAESAIYADFAEFLRPATIIGKFGQDGIPSLRQVPFRVPLITQVGGGNGYWVGQGKAKPLTAFDFDRTTMEPLKVANIAVLTEESIRDASPSSEAIVRDSLRDALVARLDIDFIDPAKALVAGVSPASITNGAQTVASSGTDADAVRLDVRSLFALFIAANNAPTNGVWIMSSSNALALSMLTNALGQPEFPTMSMMGGRFHGLPVIVSEYAGAIVTLVSASDVYLSDEGGVSVDMSREASLEMADNPAGNALTGGGASLVSMFQTNSVAIRAERTINWKRRRTTSVAYLTAAAWGGAVTPVV